MRRSFTRSSRPSGPRSTPRRRTARALDPELVIVQAPRGSLEDLLPYRPALDIAGVDIYPVSDSPQVHSDLPSKDIGVVGDPDALDRAGGGDEAGVGDAADRVERRRPDACEAGARAALPVECGAAREAHQAIANGGARACRRRWRAGRCSSSTSRTPPPPLVPRDETFRSVAVAGGVFRDWFAPHDVHVYPFPRS